MKKTSKIKTGNRYTSYLYKNKLRICFLLICIIIGALVIFKYDYKLPNNEIKQVYVKTPSFSKLYMQDVKNKNFTNMWSMYSPRYKTFITHSVGKKTYLSFLQNKFSQIHVDSIRMTPCMSGQSIFPYGVQRIYKNTCVTEVLESLSTKNSSASSQLSSFSKLPLILAKQNKEYQIVGGGPTDLQAPVLYPSRLQIATRHIPIIMYHLIQPIPDRSHYENNYGWRLDVGLTVTVANFSLQMDQLQHLGYHPISPNDLYNSLYYNLPLPHKPVVLTFDDGRLSDFTNALPILLRHHYSAVYFIPPGLTGKVIGLDGHNTYMTFDDLKKLSQDGMYIENHSLYHTLPLWDLSESTLQFQLSLANKDLYTYTNYPIQFIAYDGSWPLPNWKETTPAIQKTISVLSNMGFMMAVEDTGQDLSIEDSQYPFQLPRVRGVDFPDISFLQTSPFLTQEIK